MPGLLSYAHTIAKLPAQDLERAPLGESTQMAVEVEHLEATVADLRARGVTFERFEMSGLDVRGDTICGPRQLPEQGNRRTGHVLLRQRHGALSASAWAS